MCISAIAKALGCKIGVTRDKKRILDCFDSKEVSSLITLDWNAGGVHVLRMADLKFKVRIRPLVVCWNAAQLGEQNNRLQLPKEQKSVVLSSKLDIFDICWNAAQLGGQSNRLQENCSVWPGFLFSFFFIKLHQQPYLTTAATTTMCNSKTKQNNNNKITV